MEKKIGKYTVKVVENDDENFPTWGFEIVNTKTGEFIDEWDGYEHPQIALELGVKKAKKLQK